MLPIALFLSAVLAADAAKESGLKVVTDFPGGSAKVESIDPSGKALRIAPTPHPGKGWACWWNFKLEGITPGTEISLTVSGSGFTIPDRAMFSLDGKTWVHTAPGVKTKGGVTYTHKVEGDACRFAWGPPFGLDDARELLASAAKSCPEAQVFELCKSREGKSVPAIRICGTDKPTRGLWVNARQHAWEAGGTWVCRGLIEWLVSDAPEAVALRKTTEVFVVPIMDVDNVERGAGGKNQTPQDHNRDWTAEPHWFEVRAAQAIIKTMVAAGRFDMFLDLHNPGPGDRSPFFFVAPATILSDAGKKNLEAFIKIARQEIVGPLALDPRPKESGPNYDKNWKAISKNWATEIGGGTPVCVTLETAWNNPKSTPDNYRRVGRELALTAAKYLAGK